MDIYKYAPVVVDKIHRLFDILEQIGNAKYLSDRLSFYGGTALNFIHFSEVPRLSVDLDLRVEFMKREYIDIGYFMNPEMINKDLNKHPQIRWIIEKRKK